MEPKIVYDFLRHAFAPVLACFEPAPDAPSVWAVNDSPDPVAGPLAVERIRFDGNGSRQQCRARPGAAVKDDERRNTVSLGRPASR